MSEPDIYRAMVTLYVRLDYLLNIQANTTLNCLLRCRFRGSVNQFRIENYGEITQAGSYLPGIASYHMPQSPRPIMLSQVIRMQSETRNRDSIAMSNTAVTSRHQTHRARCRTNQIGHRTNRAECRTVQSKSFHRRTTRQGIKAWDGSIESRLVFPEVCTGALIGYFGKKWDIPCGWVSNVITLQVWANPTVFKLADA